MKFPKKLIAKAKKIKLIAMDVDGVLTGGEIIVFDSGGEIKVWNVKDRLAFHLIRRSGSGIKLAWITGRSSRQVSDRAKEIGIDEFYDDCMNKKEAILEILKKNKLRPEEVVFIGDDLIDIPVFRIVGFSVCPSDAPDEVKKEADYVSPLAGGKGILREVAEAVLKTRGFWKAAVKGYIE
jgi:3-deoxy-D-manno-octulosonate 8-phosphate phosphatase (KDO 8-P phosphatase)